MSLPLRHEKVPLVETNALNSPGMSSEYELKPSPQRQISEQYERAQQKDLVGSLMSQLVIQHSIIGGNLVRASMFVLCRCFVSQHISPRSSSV